MSTHIALQDARHLSQGLWKVTVITNIKDEKQGDMLK